MEMEITYEKHGGHCAMDLVYRAKKRPPEWVTRLGLCYNDAGIMFDPLWHARKDEATPENLIDAIYSTLMDCEDVIAGREWEDVEDLVRKKFQEVGRKMIGHCGIGRSLRRIQPIPVQVLYPAHVPTPPTTRLEPGKWYSAYSPYEGYFLIVPMKDIMPYFRIKKEPI